MHPIERAFRMVDISSYAWRFGLSVANFHWMVEHQAGAGAEHAAIAVAYYARQLAHLALPLLEEPTAAAADAATTESASTAASSTSAGGG